MRNEGIEIAGKKVQVADPYQAPASGLVGRDEEMCTILGAWMAGPPLNPLLVGIPGVGKNRVAYELARMTGKPLYCMQGHEDLRADDLACLARISDDAGKRIDYLLTPLTTAMKCGAICFIDELGKLRPDAYASLSSLLDERRYLESTVLGARIEAAPGFRFIAATNTVDLDSGRIPEYIRSRLKPLVLFGFPKRSEIDEIVRTRYPTLRAEAPLLLNVFWDLWSKHGSPDPPVPRDAVQVFALAFGLASAGELTARWRSEPSIVLDRDSANVELSADHVEQAFRRIVVEGRDAR